MFVKLYRVYVYFFKLVAIINIGVSVFAGALLMDGEGRDRVATAYVLATAAKVLGYGVSILIEKWFFAGHREYFFKNMGLGYRHIFGFVFIVDLVLFAVIIWGWKTIGNYL